jgi:hypothetical protein
LLLGYLDAGHPRAAPGQRADERAAPAADIDQVLSRGLHQPVQYLQIA